MVVESFWNKFLEKRTHASSELIPTYKFHLSITHTTWTTEKYENEIKEK